MTAIIHNVEQNDQTTNALQLLISTYVNKMKQLYHAILKYLDNSFEANDINDESFYILKNYGNNEVYDKSREEITQILNMINIISSNHHRGVNFIKKIKEIIQCFKNSIPNSLSNYEIFRIFKENKLILKYLLDDEIINISEEIFKEINIKTELNGTKYRHFFYPEIKKFFNDEEIKEIEKELLSEDPNIFNDFERKLLEGENDSYICSLIRKDSIDKFVEYVNRLNISLTSEINHSIFETNLFLIENEKTSLIEYSAFFGSIQIFNYLRMMNVELKPSIWLYAIHSQNAELFCLLESLNVEQPKFDYNGINLGETKLIYFYFQMVDYYDELYGEGDKYERSFIECIKCNHNDIANYIKNNLFNKNENNLVKNEKIISSIFQSYNYEYIPTNIGDGNEFIYFACHNYNTIVNHFLKFKEKEIKEYIVLN